MTLYEVIKKTVITEKSQQGELKGVYTVIIDSAATKVDVRNAFERLYDVSVEKVNIVKVREKFRNTRTGIQMKRKPRVKALVTLAEGQRIADFQKIKIKD